MSGLADPRSSDDPHSVRQRSCERRLAVNAEFRDKYYVDLGGLRSSVSSPSGVWSRAPAEIEFGAF